jgi:hypothetical protein
MHITRRTNIHITVKDMRELLTYNTPTYHELLIIALEIISQTNNSTFLDPSFIATIQEQGWNAVK